MSVGRGERAERLDADAPDLPCGVPYDALVTQVAERRPAPDGPAGAHQRACPHCRAALAELGALWAPVHALADQEVRAPAGLLETVMARVRELPRHRDQAVLPQREHQGGAGTTRVAARAVGAVARTAALQVPGVVLALGAGRSGRGRRHDGPGDRPGTAVAVFGGHVVLDLSVVVASGEAIPALAERVRRRVEDVVQALTGLVVTQVDVHVVDVVEAAGTVGTAGAGSAVDAV